MGKVAQESRFVARPVEVEAVRWLPSDHPTMEEHADEGRFFALMRRDPEPHWGTVGFGARCGVFVAEAPGVVVHTAEYGDWLVRFPSGRVTVWSNEEFEVWFGRAGSALVKPHPEVAR